MPLSRYCDILEQCLDLRIAGQKIYAIRLDGNREPLLYPQLAEILYETKKRGFGVGLTTNAVLLSGDKAKILIDGGVDAVWISVTGVTTEVYSQYQGSQKVDCERQLKLVMENVKAFAAQRIHKKPFIHISYIVTEKSKKDAKNAISIWRNTGVDEIGFYPDLNVITDLLEQNPYTALQYRRTGDCILSSTIASNGDVYPCCSGPMEGYAIGNCFTNTLREIYSSDVYYRLAERISSLDGEKLPGGCRTCAKIAYVRQMSNQISGHRTGGYHGV
jgi:radical SAM protein with 4Fe4S-binding SPASM domain